MNSLINNDSHQSVIYKSFINYLDLKRHVEVLTLNAKTNLEVSLLYKIDPSTENTIHAFKYKKLFRALIGKDAPVGLFHNRNIGFVCVGGKITSLFMHDIEGTKLGSFSVGPYGILRGVGGSDNEVVNVINALVNGYYIVVIRDDLDYRHDNNPKSNFINMS